MRGQKKKLSLGLTGAMLSAILTSSAFLAVTCCAGPIVFLALGLGIASFSTLESLASYRWIFLLVTMILLATAFAQIYRRSGTGNGERSCSTVSVSRTQKILLWVVAALVIVLITFPFLYEKYLLQVK